MFPVVSRLPPPVQDPGICRTLLLGHPWHPMYQILLEAPSLGDSGGRRNTARSYCFSSHNSLSHEKQSFGLYFSILQSFVDDCSQFTCWEVALQLGAARLPRTVHCWGHTCLASGLHLFWSWGARVNDATSQVYLCPCGFFFCKFSNMLMGHLDFVSQREMCLKRYQTLPTNRFKSC